MSNLYLNNSGLILQKGKNKFNNPVKIKGNKFHFALSKNNILSNALGKEYNLDKLKTAPIFTCCCYSGAGAPHALFIKNALNL